MSRRLSSEGAVSLVAKELVQLAAAVRAVDGLARGTPRVRAATAVLRAHAALGAALGPTAAGWVERGRAPLERALAAMSGETTAGFDLRAAVADAALEDARRAELLVQGLSLRGRLAVLYRVLVEVATRPDGARALAASAPAPWTGEALRLAETGVVQARSAAVFVGVADDASAERYPASQALAEACARAGALRGYGAVMRALGARDPALEVVARFASGDRQSALGRLARIARRERDRALEMLVPIAIARGGSDEETLARSIRGSERRSRAFAAIVHADANRRVVRRALLPELVDLPPLERALLAAEVAAVRGPHGPLAEAVAQVGRLLAQERSLAAIDLHHPSPWERALRCALALALAGVAPPSRLRFTPSSLVVLGESPHVRAALAAAVERAPEVAAVVERLPAGYLRFTEALRGLAIERRLARLRPAEHVGAIDLAALSRPEAPVAAIVAGALLEPGRVEVSSDARSPLRAAFDFGVALSPRAAARRTVLVHAARASLRASADQPAIVRLRVALLRELEDGGVADIAARLLAETDLPRAARLDLLELVASQRRAQLVAFVWSHFDRLTVGGVDAPAVLDLVERSGAGEAGLARAWRDLAASAGPERACAWWTSFLAGWTRAFRRPASVALLRASAASLRAGELPADGAAAAELLHEGVARWGAAGLEPLFARGSDADLTWLLLASEPDPTRAWPVPRWRALVARLRELATPDVAAVTTLVTKLPDAGAATSRALLAGAAPTAELSAALDLGAGLELVYLDKRRDLPAFLRMADAAACCFSTDGPHFERGLHTSRWVLRLHRDPLSYGFHVRRADDGAAVGFVFGGFGLVPEPALLLNGVYLRRQDAAVRAAILVAIERSLARPLGVPTIAVAARHAGSGELPSGYRFETRRGVRVRALRDASGAPEREVYDDISTVVNHEFDFAMHFKALTPVGASPAS
jgi:hypothetical protein